MIIMITAYNWGEIEEEARDAGIDFFIAKPLLRSAIYNTFLKLDERIVVESCPDDGSALIGQRILLVEDNALNQGIAKVLLETQGACVDITENGQEAVECFGAHTPNTYLAILMDIRMHILDGIEATKRIRSMKRSDAKSIPILAMTANAFEEDKKIAYDAEMTGCLVKPLDIRVLIRELEKFI